MKGDIINFINKKGESVITGTVKDTIMYSATNTYYAETHYLVVCNEGHVHIVHPNKIMDINP